MANYLRDAIRYQQEMEEANRPVTVNSLMARQFAAQRQNMTQPTSVMDPRYPAWKRAQDQADQFLMGADIAGSVASLLGPTLKGAAMAGRALAPKAADMAEGYMAHTGLLQSATDWKGSPLVKMFPSGKAGHLTDDVNMFIRELPTGKLEIERSLPWGVQANPFKMQGDNLEDLIASATAKASKSDTAKAAYEAKKHRESLLGRLQEKYGDNFTVSNSERSASQYITHTPSGTKIRVSDHDLPLGYVQPDIDLRSGQTVANQLAEIMKALK